MAVSKLGMLEGFAYQSPPPSYWRRAMVSLIAVELRTWDMGYRTWARVETVAPMLATASTASARHLPAAHVLCPMSLVRSLGNPISNVSRDALLRKSSSHILHTHPVLA